MLESTELQRYNRQMLLPELGLQGQEKLKAARVLMIGAGGLGCPVLQYLAAAGVGTLGIVDYDTIELSNLPRQILYTAGDLGMSKAETARLKLISQNAHTEVTVYNLELSSQNAASIISAWDIIVDGTDNFSTRYLVDDTCKLLGKVLVSGSIFRFEAQISVFHLNGGPGYRDLFPLPAADEEVLNCAAAGVIGILPGLAGMHMAGEVIKLICGFGEVLSGKLLTLNALDNSSHIFKLNTPVNTPLIKETSQSLPGESEKAGNSDSKENDSVDLPVVPVMKLPPPVDPAVQKALPVSEIPVAEVASWLEDITCPCCLIDVRENYEFEEGNLGGINIPLSELIGQHEELKKYERLVFYCQTGTRSKMAARLLKPFFPGSMFTVKC